MHARNAHATIYKIAIETTGTHIIIKYKHTTHSSHTVAATHTNTHTWKVGRPLDVAFAHARAMYPKNETKKEMKNTVRALLLVVDGWCGYAANPMSGSDGGGSPGDLSEVSLCVCVCL